MTEALQGMEMFGILVAGMILQVYLVAKSCQTLLMTPGTVACQVPLSMGFPRQEYCSGLPFPSPGDLPDLGIEPVSPALVDGFFTAEPPGQPHFALTFV